MDKLNSKKLVLIKFNEFLCISPLAGSQISTKRIVLLFDFLLIKLDRRPITLRQYRTIFPKITLILRILDSLLQLALKDCLCPKFSHSYLMNMCKEGFCLKFSHH